MIHLTFHILLTGFYQPIDYANNIPDRAYAIYFLSIFGIAIMGIGLQSARWEKTALMKKNMITLCSIFMSAFILNGAITLALSASALNLNAIQVAWAVAISAMIIGLVQVIAFLYYLRRFKLGLVSKAPKLDDPNEVQNDRGHSLN